MCVCYLVVIGSTEEDVVSSWVPLDEAHSATVTLELLPRYCNIFIHTVRRDFPHFNLQTHTKRTKLMKIRARNKPSLSQSTKNSQQRKTFKTNSLKLGFFLSLYSDLF